MYHQNTHYLNSQLDFSKTITHLKMPEKKTVITAGFCLNIFLSADSTAFLSSEMAKAKYFARNITEHAQKNLYFFSRNISLGEIEKRNQSECKKKLKLPTMQKIK